MKDPRRGRAGALNMLPASTGAALATTRALPDLADRFDGVVVRVPYRSATFGLLKRLASRTTADDTRYRSASVVLSAPKVSVRWCFWRCVIPRK
jgi:glyceraldehyde-3-phosphate dehydrogenase/erythrose-4-phosphate dehydrogenase